MLIKLVLMGMLGRICFPLMLLLKLLTPIILVLLGIRLPKLVTLVRLVLMGTILMPLGLSGMNE